MNILLSSEVCYLFTRSKKKLVQMRKLAFSDPDYIGKSLKPKTETFKDGSSAHLLSVNKKVFLNFEGNVVQNVQ